MLITAKTKNMMINLLFDVLAADLNVGSQSF